MMPKELLEPKMSDALDDLRNRDEPFAVATIVRTAGLTAAKPGAKALLRADGTILHGWLGGGCTKSAVAKAALKSIQDGQPQLVSIAPEDELEKREGVQLAKNGCPSKGTIDVFVEPWVPRPELVIFGASPVAVTLNGLAGHFDWDVTRPDETYQPEATNRRRVIIIATQGQGDLSALTQSLGVPSDHVAFVGSRKKYATLAAKLSATGIPKERIDAVEAPAGLDIGAVTPEEIALSILAKLTQVRRQALKGINVHS